MTLLRRSVRAHGTGDKIIAMVTTGCGPSQGMQGESQMLMMGAHTHTLKHTATHMPTHMKTSIHTNVY